MAKVFITHRYPTLRIPLPLEIEPDATLSVHWNGSRAPNGDGVPGGAAPIDYLEALSPQLRIWGPEQATLFGGGWCEHPWAEAGAVAHVAVGWCVGPWCIGAWGAPWGWWQWTFPFALRDGIYRVALRLADWLGNKQLAADEVFEFEVAALPRPASRPNVTYEPVTEQLQLTWTHSPEFAPSA